MRLRIPENLTQQAYRAIQTEIITGQFDRRKRLTEEYFASRFGISKSPIREALNRLEAEGLISILPRRGAFVIDFSIEDVREIYELREALEARGTVRVYYQRYNYDGHCSGLGRNWTLNYVESTDGGATWTMPLGSTCKSVIKRITFGPIAPSIAC